MVMPRAARPDAEFGVAKAAGARPGRASDVENLHLAVAKRRFASQNR